MREETDESAQPLDLAGNTMESNAYESGPRSQTWTGDTLMSAETFVFTQLQSGALPTELSEVFQRTNLHYLILIN